MGSLRAVGAQIWNRLPSLTPLEGEVAKKLGFAGFREFRTRLIDYRNSDSAALHSEISGDNSSGEIVQTLNSISMHALEETFAILDLDVFDRAAEFVHRARQSDLYSLGGSVPIARDFGDKFLRIGIRTWVLDDAQQNLIDVLFFAVAQCDRKSADAKLSRTMTPTQPKRRM